MPKKQTKKNNPQVFKGVIPSQNAIRLAAKTLRDTATRSKMAALTMPDRLEAEGIIREVLTACFDIEMVAQFLEERLVNQPATKKQ